ncbi:MAG: hypothetical protein ACREJB_05125, partial [Planctomycetaceae bacterium]
MRVIVAAVATLLLLVAAVAFQAGSERSNPVAAPDEQKDDGAHWVKLTFGLDGEAVSWDGGVSAREGTILESAAWSFEERDRFDPAAHKWFCTTVVLEGRSASSFAEPQRGVLLHVERQGGTTLDVTTRQGDFTVDVTKLESGRPQLYLDGRASAELLGTSRPLPERATEPGRIAGTQDDYPTLAVDSEGHRHLAWIAWEEDALRDRLRVLDLDDPNATVQEIPTAREQMNPQLVAADGALWLFWSAPESRSRGSQSEGGSSSPSQSNWDLWSSQRKDGRWTDPQRITTAPGSDFHLSAAAGPDGSVWLAWQTFREGQGDILARRHHNGTWSKEIAVADSKANEWEPSISID